MAPCSGVTFTRFGTSRLQSAYHDSTSGLQPAKIHKSAFKLAPLRTILCQSASGRTQTPVQHAAITKDKELATPTRHDYGKIRSTLGIRDFREEKTSTMPSTLRELLQLLSPPSGVPFDMQMVIQMAYAEGRTAFFAGAAFTAFLSNTEFREEVERTLNPTDYKVQSEDYSAVLMSMYQLHLRDAENVRKGYYRAPYDMDPRHRQWNPLFALSSINELHDFLRGVSQTRKSPRGIRDVLSEPEVVENRDRYPEYYLQNFHHQTGGWLSESSAKTYDMATQTYFFGCLDALVRQGLVPLHFYMKGRREEETTLLELGCGAGRLLTFIKDNYPRLNTVGVDLSRSFLDKARKNLDYFDEFKKSTGEGQACTPTTFIQSPAHDLPQLSHSVDVVSCSNLFHELPPSARKMVVAEAFRVLKPGGIFIFQDPVQKSDNSPLFAFAYKFPTRYHEPYMMSYFHTDFPKLFGEQGFNLESSSFALVAKVMCFRKPV
eukprot:TRINITY_DN8462_c0_g2_i1.p1 TRINITY_DN8462_c0_g2~~TRINITY_DN8462_c0_g2_i1.p1  ORF type:complete len:489 (+),score=63.61 TRINITY_DN8462_c0_g2_i1:180-1646(+)